MNSDKEIVSLIGEYYVLYKLAQLKIRAYKLQDRFDFDIMTTSNIKIEVKTSHKILKKDQFKKADGERTSRFGWLFANHIQETKSNNGSRKNIFKERKRICDFYILVCTDNDNQILRSYIIPNEDFTSSKTIWIPENGISIWDKYLNSWETLSELDYQVINKINTDSL